MLPCDVTSKLLGASDMSDLATRWVRLQCRMRGQWYDMTSFNRRNKADKVAFAAHAYFMCAGYKLVALGDAADLAGEFLKQHVFISVRDCTCYRPPHKAPSSISHASSHRSCSNARKQCETCLPLQYAACLKHRCRSTLTCNREPPCA
jgi:hypothetical protein